MPIIDVDPRTTWNGTSDPVEFVVQSDCPHGCYDTGLGFALWDLEPGDTDPMFCFVSILPDRWQLSIWQRLRCAWHVARTGSMPCEDLSLERNAVLGLAMRLLDFADRMKSRADVDHETPAVPPQ
jgi:hypothetical protein